VTSVALDHTSARGGNVLSVMTTTCVTSVTMVTCMTSHTSSRGLISPRHKGQSRLLFLYSKEESNEFSCH